MFLSVDRF